MNKKRIIIVAIILILVAIFGLWISGIIPKQIARISATNYLKKNFPKMQLEYIDIEWSSSFGGYSIRFKDENNEIYGFIMNNKYFPISVGQGINGFQETYIEKYEQNNMKNEINNDKRSFTKTYNVLNVADSNDENYLYITIRQFQAEEVETVKVQKSLANIVERGNSYEFTFQYTNNNVDDNIESIFVNTILVSIQKTDKQGLEQTQDSIIYKIKKYYS